MGIIKEGVKALGKGLFPDVAKAVERYGPKPTEGSRLGLLGKDILRATFPGVYAITDKFSSDKGKKPTKRSRIAGERQSAVADSVSELGASVVDTNTILSATVEAQAQQNVVLTEILKALKEGGGAGEGSGVPIPKKPSAKGGKGAKGGKVGRDAKGRFTKLKPTLGGKIANGAKSVARGAGKIVSRAPVVGGLISAGIEYSQSGNAGRAAAVGGGSVIGAGIGTALGTGAGALFGGVGAIPLGWAGGILGGIAGGAIGGLGYDMFGKGKSKEDNKDQKVEAESITYKAEDILFKSNTMVIKARELTIKGDLSKLFSSASSTDAADRAKALTGPGGVGEHLGGPKAVEQGGDKPIIGVPRLTRITAKKSKASTSIGEPYASNFQGLLDDLEATGYKIRSLGGYANRANKSDPSKLSFHGLGAALDINPDTNPFHTTQTDFPPNIGQIASSHGLGWGIKFRDPMHFSAAKKEYGGFNIQQVSMKSYASGTDYVPQTGPAIVGEKGPELVIGQKGNVGLTGNGPHITHLQKGDSILPADKTKTLLSYEKGTKKASQAAKKVAEPEQSSGINPFGLLKAGLSFVPVAGQIAAGVESAYELSQGNVKGATKAALGAIPGGGVVRAVGGMVANEVIDRVIPTSNNVKPPPAPMPLPSKKQQKNAEPSYQGPLLSQQPQKKMKKAEADTGQEDQYNSSNMLKSMFGAAA